MKTYEELDRISRSKQEYVGCHGYEHTERVIEVNASVDAPKHRG